MTLGKVSKRGRPRAAQRESGARATPDVLTLIEPGPLPPRADFRFRPHGIPHPRVEKSVGESEGLRLGNRTPTPDLDQFCHPKPPQGFP